MSRLAERSNSGRLTDSRASETWGAGVRVLHEGSFGFASTESLDPDRLRRAVRRAAELARASARLGRALRRLQLGRGTHAPDVELTALAPRQDFWQTPIRKDPWAIPGRARSGELLEAEAQLVKRRGVDGARGELHFSRRDSLFWSTEGANIRQVLFRSGGWLTAEAHQGCERVVRSWPGPGGCFRGEGFEAIEQLAFVREAERLADEVAELRRAPRAPTGTFDLILKNSILALQLHETFGHGAESDRLYGYEDNFGGSTYLDTGLLGSAAIASRLVNVVSDPRPSARTGAGTFAYDDEGVAACRQDIVKKGVLTGFLTSRETAWFLNVPQSNASMVAVDGCHQPLVRMTNFDLVAGRGTEHSLVRGVEDGLLLDNERSWSIDEIRLGFQIGAECGYRIRKGRIVGLVREPFYHGNSLDFWRSCDAVAGRGSWTHWGFSDCRKGAPTQDIFCSHGVAPTRFRRVAVGRGL